MSGQGGVETAPMKPAELGRYVCVLSCQHSPHITVRADGVWVKQGPGGPFSGSPNGSARVRPYIWR